MYVRTCTHTQYGGSKNAAKKHNATQTTKTAYSEMRRNKRNKHIVGGLVRLRIADAHRVDNSRGYFMRVCMCVCVRRQVGT